MAGQHPEEITRQLEQANACDNDTWQMWNYVVEESILVLCGYHWSFDVKGFLVFRGVSFMHVQRWIEKPVFRLGEIEEHWKSSSTQNEPDFSGLYLISISTQASKFCVICREVRFHSVPKGAYV